MSLALLIESDACIMICGLSMFIHSLCATMCVFEILTRIKLLLINYTHSILSIHHTMILRS